jgi:beta-galactosidase
MGKRIGISEYGAGANPAQGSEDSLTRPEPDGDFHPPEWQNHFHERLWAQLKGNSNLWGTWIWSMFDFAVDKRNEGGIPGLNDKGMVTRDRRTKKDTFYFYKANWSTEPMVRITSRALTPRKKASTAVKVYSNCPQVDLLVNGDSVGVAKPDELNICRWENVSLRPGPNHIEALGQSGAAAVRDYCQWTLDQSTQ